MDKDGLSESDTEPPPHELPADPDGSEEPANEDEVFKPNKKLNRTPPKKLAPIFGPRPDGADGPPKRKGSPLDRTRSVSEGALHVDNDHKRPKREDWFARLGMEIKALNKLIAAASKTSTNIKISARKLSTYWEAEQFDRSAPKSDPEANPDIAQDEATACREMGTQTPASVQAEFTAEDIRAKFEIVSSHDELLAREWPRATFRQTTLTRGGLYKPRTDAVRVILCKAPDLETNPAILRLGATHPTLKQLNEENLPAGKTAIVKCGEEIVIDGEGNDAGKQTIAVCSLETIENDELIKAIKNASQLATGNVQRIVLSFPTEIDPQRARKLTEIGADVNLMYEIPTTRQPRSTQREKKQQQRPLPDKMASFIITPSNKDVTLADIVKGMHNGVNPQALGVQVSSVRETRNGKVQVRFKESGANPAFYGKVKSVLASMATCHQRTGAVIVHDIEAGAEESDVTNAMAEALGIDKDLLNPSRITSGPRGRSMIIGMPVELTRRALQLKTIGLNWTRAKIREKVDPDFCDSCQAFGHPTKSCTIRKPVGKRCLNCGSLEHLRAACIHPTACFTCNGAQHRMNSMACPVFRDLVHQKRKESMQQ